MKRHAARAIKICNEILDIFNKYEVSPGEALGLLETIRLAIYSFPMSQKKESK